MASPTKTKSPPKTEYKPTKLQRLPSNARIEKRPILHPAIPSPYTNSQNPKVVYISTKTPFVSAVKRVRKLLSLMEKRNMGKIDLVDGPGMDKQKLKALGKRSKRSEEVLLKATSRAIEKALSLGLYFQGQGDCRIRIRTGGVSVIDDIVQKEDLGNKEDEKEVEETSMATEDPTSESATEMELPESRIRQASTIEIGISLR
ncbi:hypothetical protein MMC25_001939 [Agyrium rufum]|nr:hypothetical protein [Agyrium rufum]